VVPVQKKSSPAAAVVPSGKGAVVPKLRVPLEEHGVQVNFCKNPRCANFGVPPLPVAPRGASAKGNPYTIVASGLREPQLCCNRCNEHIPVKSNLGVVEEYQRIHDYLSEPTEATCPHSDCANSNVPVSAGRIFYSSFGKTAIGSPR
jgi:hypothetical protein